MQRIGEFEYQRTIEFSREDTVGETSLIIDNKEIVDGAKDVVEAKLNRHLPYHIGWLVEDYPEFTHNDSGLSG